MPELPDLNSRDWNKADEHRDRGVTETVACYRENDAAVTRVDAVPGLWYRPGSRN